MIEGTDSPKAERPRSQFSQWLDAEPGRREYYDEVVRELRRQAWPEIKAVLDSEMLTAEDFAIVINARAEGQ